MKTEKLRGNPAQSLLQKFYGNPKPVREYQRFGRSKIADSGEDPNGAMLEFIKHDIVRPLERLNMQKKKCIASEKWAVGTTKKCPSIEKLPKKEALKDYYFPDINEKKSELCVNKTDHISILVPKIKKKEESESFLNLKKKIGPHSETYNDSWIPQGNHKTQNNRSSVAYNILNYQSNDISGAMMSKVLDKKLNNKKKGVAEFMDLTKAFNPNFDKKFAEHHNNQPRIFHVYNGIFSHMYDAAHRNGNIVVPFRNNSVVNNEANHFPNRNNNQTYSSNRKSKSPRKEK